MSEIVKIVERGNIGSDSAEVYRLEAGRYAIGYQGQEGIHIIRKNATVLKEVGEWIETDDEAKVI